MEITAADDEGYTYKLRGELTSKRLEEGQLESTNPAVDVDTIYLGTMLLKGD